MNQDLVQVETAALGDPDSPSLHNVPDQMDDDDDEFDPVPGQADVTEAGADAYAKVQPGLLWDVEEFLVWVSRLGP